MSDPEQEIQFGPNIKDWPQMVELPENLIIKVVSEIHDPVTTTDELIPSGETSSFRSNPLGLAEFTLSRKDPEYVGKAKEIQKAEKAREAGQCMGEAVPELREIMHKIKESYDVCKDNTGVGSTILQLNPGTVRQENRQHHARRYLADGPTLLMNMPQRDTEVTLLTGVCFHS